MLLVGVLVTLAFVNLVDYRGRRDFDAESWGKGDRSLRAEMVDDLVDSELLLGLRESEVVELLGDGDERSQKLTFYLDAEHGRQSRLEILGAREGADATLRVYRPDDPSFVVTPGSMTRTSQAAGEPFELPAAEDWEAWRLERRDAAMASIVGAYQLGRLSLDDLRAWRTGDRVDGVVLFYYLVDDQYRFLGVRLHDDRAIEAGMMLRMGD